MKQVTQFFIPSMIILERPRSKMRSGTYESSGSRTKRRPQPTSSLSILRSLPHDTFTSHTWGRKCCHSPKRERVEGLKRVSLPMVAVWHGSTPRTWTRGNSDRDWLLLVRSLGPGVSPLLKTLAFFMRVSKLDCCIFIVIIFRIIVQNSRPKAAPLI